MTEPTHFWTQNVEILHTFSTGAVSAPVLSRIFSMVNLLIIHSIFLSGRKAASKRDRAARPQAWKRDGLALTRGQVVEKAQIPQTRASGKLLKPPV